MANKLEPIYNTGVKFYSSLTRDQALGKTPISKDASGNDVFVEPGAVCFVSDVDGNSIFLNNILFGDGAIASGTTGGTVGGEGGGSYVELKLENIEVTSNKTLADYFNNGTFTPDDIKILDNFGETVLTINKDGILFGTSYYATLKYVQDKLSDSQTELSELISQVELTAKNYIDSSVVSLYKVKGSISSYENLKAIVNPSIGDVYNVLSSDMNYVYTGSDWDPLGGSVDTSLFYTKNEVDKKISENNTNNKNYTDSQIYESNNRIFLAEESLKSVNENMTKLFSSVETNTTNITNNITNISNIATLLTWL